MDDGNEKQSKAKLIAVYMTIPFVLGIPPITGWLIGRWLDKLLNTDPYLMYGLILLGFVAGFREFYRIVKKFGNGI